MTGSDDARWQQDVYGAWDAQGAETRRALLSLLPQGWSLEGKRVLDFGCGTGRTLRHFRGDAETTEFWGADVDAGYLAEMQRLCPRVRAVRCESAPPLSVETGFFDLSWAISVFTHLTTEALSWLAELHRVLKPGGLLIATYMGRWNSEYVAGEPWDEDRVGMNVLQHTQGWERGGPSVLMSDWWVREHWGRAFDILAVEPSIHRMSWALLRRRDVEITPDALARPSSDPREYRALQHNLVQVQRELEVAQAVCRHMVERARREYETSLSWRVTRPLRSARALARRWADAIRLRRRLRSGAGRRPR